MGVTRYLGAGWASVHGPSTPRELALWTLELGFAGLLPSPAPRPIDWHGLRRASGDLPFDLGGAMRLAGPGDADRRPDAGLASQHRGEREAAAKAVEAAIAAAARLGIPKIVLEPGRVPLAGDPGPTDLGDPAVGWSGDRVKALLARRNVAFDRSVDAACRSLFDLCKVFPETTFCLSPSADVAGLGYPAALHAVFEDLSGYRLAYWHDAAITARREQILSEEQGDSLERFADRMAGMTLGDAADGDLQAPPGAGLVDYPLLASYVGHMSANHPAVVELGPGVPADDVPGVHSFLDKFGL